MYFKVGAAPFINGHFNFQLKVGAAPFINGATLKLEPNRSITSSAGPKLLVFEDTTAATTFFQND